MSFPGDDALFRRLVASAIVQPENVPTLRDLPAAENRIPRSTLATGERTNMLHHQWTRRTLLKSALLGSCGALAGLAAPRSGSRLLAQPAGKPSSLTITNVETFPLK